MAGKPWIQDELDRLERIVGDCPWPMVPGRYNRWAQLVGRPTRTPDAIRNRISILGLSRDAFGEWVSVSLAAKMLGIAEHRVNNWAKKYQLAAYNSGRKLFVKRLALRWLAEQRPHLFGGIGRGPLVSLLEDEELADSIAERFPSRPTGNPPMAVRCIATGKVWSSIQQAAVAGCMSRYSVMRSIKTGKPACGRRFALVEAKHG